MAGERRRNAVVLGGRHDVGNAGGGEKYRRGLSVMAVRGFQ